MKIKEKKEFEVILDKKRYSITMLGSNIQIFEEIRVEDFIKILELKGEEELRLLKIELNNKRKAEEKLTGVRVHDAQADADLCIIPTADVIKIFENLQIDLPSVYCGDTI